MTTITEPWLKDPAAQAVCGLLENAGHQAWFVGGCVRNALLGEPVRDLDISTNARPETVLKLAQAAGLRAVPTGIEHGTVTVIHTGTPFEITTFRRDVETDGRRAVVAFADTLEEDAQRRDFTMNALYADARGQIVDPVHGLDDLAARHFRFIGSARDRIAEDYLRILRYFRFFAWYGDELDPDGLAACAELSKGISQLSAERVTSELIKLLSAPDPARAAAAMEQSGVLAQTLTGAGTRALGPYLHLDPVSQVDPMARLAAIADEDAIARLRLSKSDQRQHSVYRAALAGTQSAGALGHAHGADVAKRALALRGAVMEQPVLPQEFADADTGAAAVFPVCAADLPNDLKGPAIGAALSQLKSKWICSRFQLSKDALLALL